VYSNAISAINNITETEKKLITEAKTPTAINSAKDKILAQRKDQAEKKQVELFKSAFNGSTPTQLTDEQIEA
jgi:hypothetical protein